MRKTSLVTILFAMLITFLSACKSDSEEGGTTGKPYDPNQPMKMGEWQRKLLLMERISELIFRR